MQVRYSKCLSFLFTTLIYNNFSKIYAELDELSKPFKALNEKASVQEIKSKKLELDLKLLVEERRESIDFRRKGAPSLEKVSPEEKLKMQIEKLKLAESLQ